MNQPQVQSSRSSNSQPGWLEFVRKEVSTLHYGKVGIVVEGGKAVEIERTDRIRFDKERSSER